MSDPERPSPAREVPPVPPLPSAPERPAASSAPVERDWAVAAAGALPASASERGAAGWSAEGEPSTAELATAAGILPPTVPAPVVPRRPALPRRRIASTALVVAIVSLAGSIIMGWFLPLALVAVILAIVALARRSERGARAGWAFALGMLALVYSAGWILWTLSRLEIIG